MKRTVAEFVKIVNFMVFLTKILWLFVVHYFQTDGSIETTLLVARLILVHH